MKKWSKEKAWEWYNSFPWIRGFNYYPSCCYGSIEFFQEYNWENVKKVIDKELSLAKNWGFNAVRISTVIELFCDQKESYLKNFEEFVQICDKHNIYVMIILGNDCVGQKEEYKYPTYGEQTFHLGYHFGQKPTEGIDNTKPGYQIIDEPEYLEKHYEMVHEFAKRYSKDKRIIFWDIYNEPGNTNRGMMCYPVMKKIFEIVRSYEPIQPCSAACWSYDDNDQPFQEVELLALEMSDVISYHGYMNFKKHHNTVQYLKEKYDRPLFNTEWLHRVWNNNVFDLFPYFRKNKISCFNWGWITGKIQTREPWEWLFNEYDNGKGTDWDFTKWQHDLVRPNLRPYDYKEFEVIKREIKIADEEFNK